jgi:hypothetical protein
VIHNRSRYCYISRKLLIFSLLQLEILIFSTDNAILTGLHTALTASTASERGQVLEWRTEGGGVGGVAAAGPPPPPPPPSRYATDARFEVVMVVTGIAGHQVSRGKHLHFQWSSSPRKIIVVGPFRMKTL